MLEKFFETSRLSVCAQKSNFFTKEMVCIIKLFMQ